MLATGLPRPRRPWLLLAALAARPCGAWVVFDGARLDEAVPGGQFAKNTSNVLSTYETMRLINTDGFPAAFRWSAQPALRYAISPDFCKSMSGHIIEEDGWIKDMWCAGARTPPPEPLPHSHTRRRGRRPSQRRSASLYLSHRVVPTSTAAAAAGRSCRRSTGRRATASTRSCASRSTRGPRTTPRCTLWT